MTIRYLDSSTKLKTVGKFLANANQIYGLPILENFKN